MDITVLKLLALVFMTVDHAGQFLPGMPICLRWIGRLASPLFFFCAAEGYAHTRSRRNYLLRLYLMGQLMTLLSIALPLALGQTGTITNNVFLEIFAMLVLTALCIRMKKWWQRLLIVIGFLVWQLLLPFLADGLMLYESPVSRQLLLSVLGCPVNGLALADLLIPVFWWCRGNRRRLTVSFAVLLIAALVFDVLALPSYAGQYLVRLTGTNLFDFDTAHLGSVADRAFRTNFYWMMYLSLPLLLCYNGKRGKGLKYLFYAYYPAHIAVLYTIGTMMG